MTLTLTQSLYAVGPRVTSSFLGLGGVGSLTYSVLAGGAGGTINSSTGVYTAPAAVPANQKLLKDTIKVVDSNLDEATATILVGTPLLLLCEIIQREMNLINGRVYLWDQKIMQPTDSDLYVAVSVPSCRPFANNNRGEPSGGGVDSAQYVNMQAMVDIDLISRGTAARDRKEDLILALNSNYCQNQQMANSFYIGKLPVNAGMRNLSEIDGAAIPYRYKISVHMLYVHYKTSAVDYFDDFENEILTDPE